jgi:hypothetical protein
MAATPQQQHSNLNRLLGSIVGSPPCSCADDARAAACLRDAQRMPLSHSAPERAMASILQVAALVSADRIHKPKGAAESAMGTTDDVFLYLCSMAYPDNEFGFLFRAELTSEVQGIAIATPFDSGGCHAKLLPPAGEDGVSFVRNHELPVPECRVYLGRVLASWFASTDDYLDGLPCKCACGTQLGDPHGLSTRPGVPPDSHGRSRTHEVRIPGEVRLDSGQLLATFAPYESGDIQGLGTLQRSGVKIIPYESENYPTASHALRITCSDYIRNQILP